MPFNRRKLPIFFHLVSALKMFRKNMACVVAFLQRVLLNCVRHDTYPFNFRLKRSKLLFILYSIDLSDCSLSTHRSKC